MSHNLYLLPLSRARRGRKTLTVSRASSLLSFVKEDLYKKSPPAKLLSVLYMYEFPPSPRSVRRLVYLLQVGGWGNEKGIATERKRKHTREAPTKGTENSSRRENVLVCLFFTPRGGDTQTSSNRSILQTVQTSFTHAPGQSSASAAVGRSSGWRLRHAATSDANPGGRVTLTPGCQIGYMDPTGCHQFVF